MRFRDKVALITGGASGIGARIACDFAREGAKIAIFDIHEAGSIVEKMIKDDGGEAIFVPGSVTRKDDVEKFVRKSFDTYGAADYLINSAGILKDSMFIKMSEEDWDQVIDVNLKGTFLVTQAVVRRWIDAARTDRREKITDYPDRRIITISSMAANGNVGQTNYSASKAGTIGLTLTWAKELVRYNIRSHAIKPTIIDTGIVEHLLSKQDGRWKTYFEEHIPFGIGKPKYVSDSVLFLCSKESYFLNGQILEVNGGLVGEV